MFIDYNHHIKDGVLSMSELVRVIGQRIRNHRMRLGLSQEKLAELAGCHHTYIGQLERGEKNATIESIEKISAALGIPMSQLFEQLGVQSEGRNIPLECYELLVSKPVSEQEQLYRLLLEIERYKGE